MPFFSILPCRLSKWRILWKACSQALLGLYKTNNIYKSKMNCELNFRFIIFCQLNQWNKRLFMWCTINANIFSLSVLQLFSEIDWIITVVIEIDWMITAVSLVFQVRDGLRLKNPMVTANWPDTDEKENRLTYSNKLKYYNYERKQKWIEEWCF